MMVSRTKRAFIDVAVEACVGLKSSTGYKLLATNGTALGAVGVEKIVHQAVATNRLYQTAQELGAEGNGLQTLLLIDLDNESLQKKVWIIDGWSLICTYGENIDLQGAYLRGAQLKGAGLKRADLQDADLGGADLEKADLSYANLTGANLAGSLLFSASLQGADLTEAELCRADLRHADLRESICVRTAFRGADLWEAYMWDVDLSQAFVSGADFQRSNYLNTKVNRET